MLHPCGYCNGPLAGPGYAGRPWPGREAAAYCCYGCLSLGESERSARNGAPPRPFRLDGFALRIGVSLFVVGQSTIFGLGINLSGDEAPPAVRRIVQGTILAATLVVVALLGGPLFRNAVAELRRRRVTVELLFLLTLTGALFASLQSFLTGRGPIYFEVVSVLLVVYSLGKAVGARSRSAALASSKAWARELSSCRLRDGAGRVSAVPAAAIRPGDTVEVRPGESFGVDGIIREGTGFVSEAATRGEPFAAVRRPGDRVLAGAVCHDALFAVEATAAGSRRQIDRLLRAVESAKDKPLSMQARADRLTAVFLPVLLLAAGGTFAYWTAVSGWQVGLFRAMSVLLVSCPCALGLATPIVLWSALGRLAERGIVVQSGDVVERLATADRVVFDKTGTLTEDRYALADLVTFASGDGRREVVGWLAAVERKSDHPVARAFAELGEAAPDVEVASFAVSPGLGVAARIRTGRGPERELRIGQVEWFADRAGELAELEGRLLAADGHRIAFAVDGKLAGLAVLTERLRDSAGSALAALERMGIPVEVLTGDRTERAAALGLPNPRGSVLPEQKGQYLRQLVAAGGRPAMVGDGINDAAALKSAHVGLALASGTDLALEASDAVLYAPDLRALPWAIALSREAVRVVRRNIHRAVAYNVVGIALAACGLLHPIAAALLMVVSSLLVAWSSVRIGVPADFEHCLAAVPPAESRPPRSLEWKVLFHALAFLGQGWLAVEMLDLRGPGAAAAILGFTLTGAALTGLWSRRPTLALDPDMAFGMLSLGNFGMLLGWWADNRFAPFESAAACDCLEAVGRGDFKPWMTAAMLAFGNAAMLGGTRRPHPNLNYHRFAMFTGGNLGMVAGMAAGGWAAGTIPIGGIAPKSAAAFAGMTFGMVAGMIALTRATQRLLLILRSLVQLPKWLAAGGEETALQELTAKIPSRSEAAARGPRSPATSPPNP